MNRLLQAPQDDLHPSDDVVGRGMGGDGTRGGGSGSGPDLHLTVSITV